jgi:chemotaxis response regulator CheB
LDNILSILRVLVMAKNSLLNSVLTDLLSKHAELFVMAGEAVDVESLMDEITHFAPEVVLMGQSIPLASTQSLSRVMALRPGLRVILVSEDTNWLHIYHKEDVLLTCADDFYQAVQSA